MKLLLSLKNGGLPNCTALEIKDPMVVKNI